MNIEQLHKMISEVCPIDGINSNGKISFSDAATEEQKSEAQLLIDKHLPNLSSDTYVEKRQREYPPIGDQLDAIMKWLATEKEVSIPAELKSLAAKCMSVKSKYPKPEAE